VTSVVIGASCLDLWSKFSDFRDYRRIMFRFMEKFSDFRDCVSTHFACLFCDI
jgi:hypothetical protein